MSEYLILRLGHVPEQPVPWLIWSTTNSEIIASGELPDAYDLVSLAERASSREVIVLVSGKDVYLGKVALPAKARRQALHALPYLLEEELAGDVEQQHVVAGSIEDDHVQALAVQHRRMEMWRSLLQDAGITTRRMIPDILALPQDEQQRWHMVALGDSWLLRTGDWQGLVVTSAALPAWSSLLLTEYEDEQLPVEAVSYSPWTYPELQLQVDERLAELPLAALIPGALNCPVNLLCGRYAQKREYAVQWHRWRWVAGLFGMAVLLHLAYVGLSWYRLEQQGAQVQDDIVQVYRSVVPGKGPIHNLRGQMTVKLRGLAQTGSGTNVLQMMQSLLPGFAKVDGLKLESLRFDSDRAELRLQLSAGDFQAFESLKQVLQPSFSVEIGALNSQGERVTGAVTLRSQS